ncbi:aminotransferase class V-fold PLP-dependent enzyme [Streptomyces sp. Ru87]|uniref:aminotransferase class V-fold PLP-dependent enzyme n=1 Tax=Streptomyces sp. Ru87 TaxID=2044307 RepID=UPI00211D8C71|nr:aminotransferase class V-fold PLP-dependent enzyme [Streptomyces sp. Ru87]
MSEPVTHHSKPVPAPVPGLPADRAAGLAARAARLDAADPLAKLRDRFVLESAPAAGDTAAARTGTGTGTETNTNTNTNTGTGTGTGPGTGRTAVAPVYLDGNSLGALPAHVPDVLAEVVGHQWGRLRIRSWEESGWWSAPERIGDRIAPLVGAAPGQVVVGDSTSVNVFKAVVAAVRIAQQGPSGAGPAGPGGIGAESFPGGSVPLRDEILVDAATFPTDGYIAESAARMTGCRIRAVPPGGMAAAFGPRTAAALANHVDYRTGRLHDLPGVTAAAHAAGAVVVWDLCHSAGALPVGLDEHGVDLAVGCTYKYLNGGPGSPAFLYVRRDLQPRFDSPLPGWNSHADPFGMAPSYTAADGAARGRVGTPDILSLLALEAALDVWDGVSVEDVRAESLALTDFFLECVAAYVPEGRVESVTPAAHAERGSQIALRCPDAGEVMRELVARGVVGDFRRPDVLRFGFTPLYVGFADTERAARVLADVLAEHERRAPAAEPGASAGPAGD